MRAARVKAWGPPETIAVEDVPDPEPAPGEAVVNVVAAAVNYPDVLIVANKYQVSVPPPFTPGSEFAGVVRALGEGTSNLHLGDRVHGSTFVGAFAENVAVPAAGLHLVPDGVTLQQAAAHGVVYATAYSALRSVADVGPGDWVVALGAAGGVGLATVDVAQVLGARVLAAASSDTKLEVCTARGAEAVVNYATDDLKSRAKELTDGGADVVIDPVGGRHAEEALRATRWGGRFVTVGYASGEIPRIPLNLVLLKGVVVKGFEMRTFGSHAPALAQRDRAELRELFLGGRIRPHISAAFPLERTGDALRLVADRQAVGKVVIEP